MNEPPTTDAVSPGSKLQPEACPHERAAPVGWGCGVCEATVPGMVRGRKLPHGRSIAYELATSRSMLRAGGAALLLLAGVLVGQAGAVLLIPAYLLVGWPVLAGAGRNIIRGRVFNELSLMSIATLGAIAIGEFPEAVAVMVFYTVGESMQNVAVARSRASIGALMDLRPEVARVLDEDGTSRLVDPGEVPVGTLLEVRSGERIPLDGRVEDGQSFVDTRALTGESVPRRVGHGDEVLAGFVNEEGKLRVRTTKPLAESSVSKVLDLVEHAAERKAPTEKFITKFAAVYTPIVVAVAGAVAFLPPLLGAGSLAQWGYRALVILVVSCPCALVVSIPLGYFGGVGAASRRKVLVKGANKIDALRNVDTVVFDKTGTLTKGVFQVNELVPAAGFSASELLSLAAAAESHSSHPIARSVRAAYHAGASEGASPEPSPADTAWPPAAAVDSYREEKGYGVTAELDGRTVLAGNDRLLHREQVPHPSKNCSVRGTVVHVAVDGRYAGYLVVADELKPEAAAAVRELRALGVRRIVMLTGDDGQVAAEVAQALGIDEWQAELLPEGKVEAVEALDREKAPGRKLAFIGDGINDAPVIVRSDIGFAMGGLGSDAAIEAADVVLMDDSVTRIGEAVRIGQSTRRIVVQNIVFALGVKLLFIALGTVGVVGMWEAVFGDMGVTLIALLNATRTLRFARRPASGLAR